MALVAAVVITGIAVGLLAIYGADVAAGYAAADGEGFLPFDHMARGLGLGLPSLILPIVAFVIARNEPSQLLGILILIAGLLILVGGAAVVVNADPTKAEETGRSSPAGRSRGHSGRAWGHKTKTVLTTPKDMQVCAKCRSETDRVYDCEHTNHEKYCKYCYTELHYYLTEQGSKNPNY